MSFSTIVAADVAYALQDAGVAFTHNADTGYGKLRRAPIEAATDSGLEKIATQYTFIVTATALTTPHIDDAITIGGVAYIIRDIDEPLPDGTVRLTVVPST